jgi:hypothetical protein
VKSRLPFCVLALLSTLLLVFAWHCYPVLSGDSRHFVPTSFFMHDGLGFRNPLWPLLRYSLDATGESRFTGNGFLYPLYLVLAPTSELRAFYILHALLGISTLVFIFLLLRGDPSPTVRSLALVSIAAPLTVFGRPEQLAGLFVLIGLYATTHLVGWIKIAILSLCLSAIVVTAPVTALFAFLLIPLIGVGYNSLGKVVKELMLIAGATVAGTSMFLVVWYPHPAHFWFEGLRAHLLQLTALSAQTAERGGIFDVASIRYYLIFNPMSFGVGIFVYVAALLLTPPLLRASRDHGNRFAALVIIVALTVLALLVIAIRPSSFYWILPFCPPLIVGCCRLSAQTTQSQKDWARRGLVFLLFVLSLPFVRTLYLFPVFLNQGMSFDDAQKQFQEIEKVFGPGFAADGASWVLSGRKFALQTVNDRYPNALAKLRLPIVS